MLCRCVSLHNTEVLWTYSVSQEEDLQEMEDSAKKMEAQFGQFFDQVIVNDNTRGICAAAVCSTSCTGRAPVGPCSMDMLRHSALILSSRQLQKDYSLCFTSRIILMSGLQEFIFVCEGFGRGLGKKLLQEI